MSVVIYTSATCVRTLLVRVGSQPALSIAVRRGQPLRWRLLRERLSR